MTLLRKLPANSTRSLLGVLSPVLAGLGLSAVALGVEPAGPVVAAKASAQATGPAQQVEMFAAMKSGELDVKFIPKNDREANVLLKNNTKRPLSVKLPDAFAGVPALGQAAGGGRRGGGGGNQGGGGGMGGMGGGGMFNIPPEQVKQLKVDIVCLEHGKKDPRPKVPYEIRPIESFTTKPGVAELCAMLGRGEIDQRAAQVAAWHLNSDLSWEQLASKRIEHLDGTSEPYFTPIELAQGAAIAETAQKQAAQSKPKAKSADSAAASPGESAPPAIPGAADASR